MPTSTISNTVLELDAVTALPNVEVTIDLIPGPGFRVDTGTEVAPRKTVYTDGTGLWIATLEESSNISPSGQLYRAVERVPTEKGGKRVWYFNVPASNGTLFANLVNPSTVSGFITPTVVTSATRPAAPFVGQMIFESDTGKVLFYYGTTLGWLPNWGTAWGEVAYFEKTSSPFATSSTVYVDATGFTTTFTAVNGRRYITDVSLGIENATTDAVGFVQLHDGVTGLLERPWRFQGSVAWQMEAYMTHRSSGTESGVKTRKLQAKTSVGTAVFTIHATSTDKGLIVVKDVGSAAAPVIT